MKADGSWDIAQLGRDLEAGERPQVVVPAGTWFGTELIAGADHCLVGCTVAPGFEFADFELAERADSRRGIRALPGGSRGTSAEGNVSGGQSRFANGTDPASSRLPRPRPRG